MQRCGRRIWTQLLHDLRKSGSVVRHDVEAHFVCGGRNSNPVRRNANRVTCSVPFLETKHLLVSDGIQRRRSVFVPLGRGGGVGGIHLIFREDVGADPLGRWACETDIVMYGCALNVFRTIENLVRRVIFTRVARQDDVIFREEFGGDLTADREVEGSDALRSESVDLIAFERVECFGVEGWSRCRGGCCGGRCRRRGWCFRNS